MKAIVIGAGIGGLTAGIALRRAGVDVEVFERAPQLTEVGAGISLWANAIAALRTLGLAGEVERASVAYDGAGLRSSDGRSLGSISVGALKRRFPIPIVVLHRAELMGILRGAFQGSALHVGKTAVTVSDDGAAVRVAFADGTSATADVVIGADGLHSIVRSTLHGEAAPRYAGCTAWRSVVLYPTARVATETWGRGNIFGQVPMSGGRVYWYATQNGPPGASHADERQALLDIFGGWHEPIPALIRATAAGSILRNDIYDRPPLDRWGRGRVTLLGDAAHPMTPYLGQGGCQAIEDAVALGRALAGTQPIGRALRAYESARIPRTTMFVNRSRYVGGIAQLEQPLGVSIRNSLFRMLPAGMQTAGVLRMLETADTQAFSGRS